MLILMWLVVCLVVVAFVLLLPLLWRRDILNRYSGTRPVTCPENQGACAVKFDAQYAVETEMDGRPALRLCDCSRWPERAECDQACLSQAIKAEPYRTADVAGTKQIYHIPIFLAAFAAWCVGAVWHSQFIFRPQWIAAVGLNRGDVKQMVWWISPHLLTFGICLLFAYGVAWLLMLRHRKGVLQGVMMAALICLVLLATTWYGVAKLPHDVLEIEAGYIALAAVIMGAMVGGLFDKLAMRTK